MENYHLVSFSNDEDFILLHVLTKCNLPFVNSERVRLDPFTFDNDLTTNIFVYLPQSQEVDLMAKSIGEDKFVSMDESRWCIHMGLPP